MKLALRRCLLSSAYTRAPRFFTALFCVTAYCNGCCRCLLPRAPALIAVCLLVSTKSFLEQSELLFAIRLGGPRRLRVASLATSLGRRSIRFGSHSVEPERPSIAE